MRSETVNFLASMLTEYMKSTIKVRGLTRTLVDSIDCYTQNNGVFLNTNGNVRFFNWGDLRNARRRKDLLDNFPHISKNARKLLSSANKDTDIPNGEKQLVCDHVMPVSALEKHLRGVEYDKPCDTLNFLKDHYRRCIITTEENIRLNENGLSRNMPTDWNSGTCPFMRYDKVEIELER